VKETFSVWLVSPVTLTLAGALVGGFIVILELLVSSLARLGNVRFQGILEDHPKILPPVVDLDTHLSKLTDILRWIEVGSVGLLWLIIARLPFTASWHTIAVAVVSTGSLILISRLWTGSLSEDSVARLLKIVSPLVGPFLRVVGRNGMTSQPVAPTEDEEEEASEREIQAYLEAGQAAGIFEGEEGEFVESLVDFFDTVVREVMTPRTEMVTAPDTVSVDELLQTFAETLKSRIPVYHETIDKVTGVVHVKNCVQYAISDVSPDIGELVNPCLVVPETKELGELLRDFQQNQQQMAIVVDEYGGTSGLVTLEDILEEIVGEIEDEHDSRQPPEWQEIDPGVFRLQGRAPLEVLGSLFGREIHEEDVDTVGGLVFSRHGTVPESGTEVTDEIHSLVFVVEEMDERRIVSVTVREMDRPEAPAVES
jgi:CBS domain containing-hemolysin-like protein